jgi:transcriptional regulator with XRE-family HTH domain
MPVSQKELGQRLRAAREACRMTQEEVAQHLGPSRSTVAQMELGNRAITGLELERLAYLFGRDMREFFAEEFQEEDSLISLFWLYPDVDEQTDVVDTFRRCLALGREVTNLERLLGIDRALGAVAAHHFRVSYLAVLYRLHNLGFMTKAELERVKAQEENARAEEVASLLGLPESHHEAGGNELRRWLLSLALEALRQDVITWAKLQALVQMVEPGPKSLAHLLCDMRLGDREEEGDVLLPEA